MKLFELLRLGHILAAMWFVSGLVGRTYSLREARASDELTIVARLSALAGIFDRYLVVPGSQAVLALGVLAAWVGGYPLLGSLQGASRNWLLVSVLLFAASVVMVPTIFIPSGKAFDRALQAAVAEGRVTEGLTLALMNPRVAWAHRLELAIIAVIIVLMILKPF